ncbi:hypothetical protein GCM10010965_03800 [Caldalkalibacillus thermarum]|uniref:CapA family protein n=1 Tax=Caldalkalibacillus thermarum TaxID=296745 RepID=UPI0016643AA4|nr:CapA family protein [Caldalkalibacillus thermarum]GGK14040.1 hypothetical protein GCM10010965_03800 [Caldalkalibacillus thermarum]
MRTKWLIITLIVAVLATGCAWLQRQETPGADKLQIETQENQQFEQRHVGREDPDSIEEAPKDPQNKASLSVNELRIMVVGDIMMHLPQIEAGKTAGGYDFFPFFEKVQPLFEQADLVLGNLETTFGGPERGYSGYPLFSAPDELAENLKQAGFDVITTANNHALDSGEQGVIRTIETLEAAGLQSTGTFRCCPWTKC